MLENFEARYLAAQGRAEDLRKQSVEWSVKRAASAEKRRRGREAQLAALQNQVEALQGRASSSWEYQRKQAAVAALARPRGA